MRLNLGLDIGSTTIKLVALDEDFEIVYSVYRRHFSDVEKTLNSIILDCYEKFSDYDITVMVTGSGGLSVHQWLDIPFVQEVVASTKSVRTFIPDTDVVIELGGEDAKIIYFDNNIEQRMNSICAGGTGAFIDQMASLIETDAEGLNNYSKNYKTIYPIASRCGVFAKTDIQSLMNQGVSKEDISVSIFQSVVNQTISTLACGRKIEGKVAFLGGPLYFLSGLRERYIDTLELADEDVIFPENSQLFVAIGAAVSSVDEEPMSFKEFRDRILELERPKDMEIQTLEPLFKDEEELRKFEERHKNNKIKYNDIETYRGKKYLGIDAGSTTTKAILIDEDSNILYSYYGNNKGKPLDVCTGIVKEIYDKMPEGEEITYSSITGYGEEFIKSALNIDIGEVETIAHYEGAKFFNPDVDLILDIGGQDMKCIKIKNGVIENILLNEACSSGCGSFIETFAKSVNMDVADFVEEGLLAKNPVDLGSRCTVFMNSMVKQAQKEGKTVGDISAGLSYSVIKNTLQKVIKIRDPKELGENIIVQGGTFYGNGILRSFEKLTEREVIRPEIAGLMGALGSALIAKERDDGKGSSIISLEEVNNFSYKTTKAYCGKCSNNCLLTINTFDNKEKYITGNRCERGVGLALDKNALPNLYEYKYNRTFDYKSLEKGKRGRVGIPRILNMYENYPFWHTFFTDLGYSVVLSEESTRSTYEKGIVSISSETACYPAKLSHGHIMGLLEEDIDFIFHPSVFYERVESDNLDNHINCPVVIGYSEVLKNNIDELDGRLEYKNPFMNFNSKKNLKEVLYDEFKSHGVSKSEIDRAVDLAYLEQDRYKEDIMNKGEETIEYLRENNLKGIVLSGRPYHIDPEVNHGIPELITSLGYAVLTEDSVAHLGAAKDLRVLNQWVYHSRLYNAAEYVAENDNLELIQLNSFGCGLDAVTVDQVEEILNRHHKLYTVLKIDEVSNLGAAKIRVRSLNAALKDREGKSIDIEPVEKVADKVFTKEMKKNHTILVPQMSPIHFSILESAVRSVGYNMEFLPSVDKESINVGLKYVNNDACYPSIITIGQIMSAIKSGKYDLDNLTVLMSQTGGACRASNYSGFIRKALKDAGYENIPVLSVSVQGIESHPGFNISMGLVRKGLMAILYGDLLSRVVLRTRPYEVEEGSVDRLYNKWDKKLREDIKLGRKRDFIKNVEQIVEDFDKIDIDDSFRKPRVGIVGEILIKYHPTGNNDLIGILEDEGAEVVISDIADFLMYCFYNAKIKNEELGKGYLPRLGGSIGISYMNSYRKYLKNALENSERFDSFIDIEELAEKGEKLVSLSNQYGEGWLLTAEMIELVETGTNNIICVQPFGCLPNHITGKGMIKPIRNIYEDANIVAIDYDPGASEVNQLNRIKLMLSSAYDKI